MKVQGNINFNSNELKALYDEKYNALSEYASSITPQKELISDCIQELFLNLCENKHLIGQIQNRDAYLMVSLRRLILKKIKKDRKQLSQKDNLIVDISVPSYEEHLINSQDSLQASLKMKKCLEQLSPAQKTVLTLKFYKDLSHDQIAKQLNISKRTVYNQIYEAIKKMKNLMQD